MTKYGAYPLKTKDYPAITNHEVHTSVFLLSFTNDPGFYISELRVSSGMWYVRIEETYSSRCASRGLRYGKPKIAERCRWLLVADWQQPAGWWLGKPGALASLVPSRFAGLHIKGSDAGIRVTLNMTQWFIITEQKLLKRSEEQWKSLFLYKKLCYISILVFYHFSCHNSSLRKNIIT